MGACGSKHAAEELNFSSLEAADDVAKLPSVQSALPPSAEPRSYPAALSRYTVTADVEPKAAQEEKLDPADFIISKREDELIVKEPGQVRGQALVIEECKNCDIFVLDHSAAVNIDVCEHCRFYIGPCESAVFIRDTSYSAFVVAAQQLRIRDCNDLSLLLYVSASQPVIESSHSLHFSSFSPAPSYPQLSAQFIAASLHPFNSQWSNVHDFNPNDTHSNWDFLPYGTAGIDIGITKSISAVTAGRVEQTDDTVVPDTWGERPLPLGGSGEHVLLLVRVGDEAGRGRSRAYELVRELKTAAGQPGQSDHPALLLLRTRSVRLTDDKARAVTGADGIVGRESLIALHVYGKNPRPAITQLMHTKGWSDVVLVDAARTSDSIETLFEAAAQV